MKTSIEKSTFISSSKIMTFFSFRRSFDDQFEFLSQIKIHDENSQFFNITFDFWCKKIEIFRVQYINLREILKMLKFHFILFRLFVNYSIFRRKIQNHLSQLFFRKFLISFILKKQTIRKKKSKRIRVRKKITKYFYFFDFNNFFKRIFLSQLIQNMHVEFDEFRTNFVEFWQSQCWTESIKITSNQYVRYRNQISIFSSNWMLYRKNDTKKTKHFDRVVEINRDFRDFTIMKTRENFVVKIQHAMRSQKIFQNFHELRYFQKHEIILLSIFFFVIEILIFYHYLYVTMNYTRDENQSKISRILSQNDVNHFFYLIRCFIIVIKLFHSFCYSFFLRTKFEFQKYERNYFCDKFNCVKNIRCIFLFLFFFRRIWILW